jgi:transposase InsO family protein
VDRAMRALGLSGIRRAKGVRTTIPAKDGRRAGDLLNRDFTACAPNRTWVMDTKCRRRHLMSYADLWTMPTGSAMAQVGEAARVAKVGIVRGM